jgi:hypothetical protein
METMNTINPQSDAVLLGALRPCDTLHVRTRSSDYRIFLLDPKTGRSIVQGGDYLCEPIEATVTGSTSGGPIIKVGSLDIGYRMEVIANGKRLTTSPIQSFQIERGFEDAHLSGNGPEQ